MVVAVGILGDPFAYGKPIGFIGKFWTWQYARIFAQNTNSVVTEGNSQRKSSFFHRCRSKYYLARGWGFRMLLDYYRRAEQYSIAEEDQIILKW